MNLVVGLANSHQNRSNLVARLLILSAMVLSLASCAATYQGARQDVGTGVEKLGGLIKPDEKK